MRVLTVDLAIAEVCAKLAREGRERHIAAAASAVQAGSEVIRIGVEAGQAAGPLLKALRKKRRQASLADAVMLAVARERGAMLVSNDVCFAGEKDVRAG